MDSRHAARQHLTYVLMALALGAILMLITHVPSMLVVAAIALVVWLAYGVFVAPATSQLRLAWPRAYRRVLRRRARWIRRYRALHRLSPVWFVLGCLGLTGMGLSLPLYFSLHPLLVAVATKLFIASAALLGVVQFVPRIAAITRWALASAVRRYPFAVAAAAMAFIANSKARDLAAVATGEDPSIFVTFLGLATILITPLVYVSAISGLMCVWSIVELVVVGLAACARALANQCDEVLARSPWASSRFALRLRRRAAKRARAPAPSTELRVPYMLRPVSMVLLAVLVTSGWSQTSDWLDTVMRPWAERTLVVMDFHPTTVCDDRHQPHAAKVATDRFVVATLQGNDVSFHTIVCPRRVSSGG